MANLDRKYDVLVIGGGNAGLCAAVTAKQAGCSVLLIEHAPQVFRGGNSRHTRNLRVAHEKTHFVLTGSYSETEYWEDLLRVTAGNTDEELAKLTISATSELLPWMQSCGVRFQPSLSGTLSLSRTNAFFFGGGKTLVNSYYAISARLGIDVLYDSEVQDMVMQGSRFVAAKISHNGFPKTVEAKAAVVASGGFQANIEWLEEYWGPSARNFIVRGTPYARGRVLKSLLTQGVKSVGDPTQCHAVAIDARSPKFDGGIVTRLDCVPFSVVVNKEGRRFYDEGEDFWPKRYAIWGRMVAQQDDQIAYCILDSKSLELFMPSVFPPVQANTIEGLATQLGLDATAVSNTVREYNQHVRDGQFDTTILDDCHTEGLTPAKTHWARRIDAPPFYGYPLRPGITFTYMGVKVDRHARVAMDDGKPAENLFAAGEIMAGNILGKGYLAGIGMSIGTVFGRISGKEAARNAQQ
jgi:tricarballylate dehydrogenase